MSQYCGRCGQYHPSTTSGTLCPTLFNDVTVLRVPGPAESLGAVTAYTLYEREKADAVLRQRVVEQCAKHLDLLEEAHQNEAKALRAEGSAEFTRFASMARAFSIAAAAIRALAAPTSGEGL